MHRNNGKTWETIGEILKNKNIKTTVTDTFIGAYWLLVYRRSWLLNLICSVLLALRVDIVKPERGPAPTAYLCLQCRCSCPSVRLYVLVTWPVGGLCENALRRSQQNTHIGGAAYRTLQSV